MSTVLKHWTYDDYAALPDDGRRYEVIDGELILVPAPSSRHQRVVYKLAHLLNTFLDEQPIGEVGGAPWDVVLGPSAVVQPDLFFIANAHRSIIGDNNIQGAPDLCIEVLSDATRKRDETRKRALYDRFGVAEYWIIDPEAKWVKVWRGNAMTQLSGDDVLTSPLLPQFAIAVGTLFRYDR